MEKIISVITFGTLLCIMINILIFNMKLCQYILPRIKEMPDNNEYQHFSLGAVIIHFIAEIFLIVYCIIQLVLVFVG